MPNTRSLWLFILVCALVGCVTVGSSWRLLSQTIDEPAHVSAGFEWLNGSYSLELQHPPLARLLFVAPARLAGIPQPHGTDWVDRGNQILYWSDAYLRNLALVRAGNLVFFLLGLLSVVLWGRHLFDLRVAAVASLFYVTLPPILAHAGLATTDMAAASTIPLALYAWTLWLERPTAKRTVLLTLAMAGSLLTKFSFLVYFPPGALVIALCHVRELRTTLRTGWRSRALQLLAAVAGVALLAWATYRFSFLTPASVTAHGEALEAFRRASPIALRPAARWVALNLRLPAAELFAGIAMLKAHAADGHLGFCLGRYSETGFWYYFPVAFFYKTPIAFLLFSAAGCAALVADWRQTRDPRRLAILGMPLAVMAAAMPSTIDIGLRHVLPLYPPLAIVAAAGALWLWNRASRRSFARASIVALASWMAVATLASRPNYIGWFNAFAGDDPGSIVSDSNIDWGQDFLALRRTLRAMHIEQVSLIYFGSVELGRMNFPYVVGVRPDERRHGWLVASETPLKLGGPEMRGKGYRWLELYRPVRKIGDSMRLYYIP